MVEPVYKTKIDELQLCVFQTREQMGKYAAKDAADCMKELLKQKEKIRMVFAAAPSQNEFLEALKQIEDIPWDRVEAFHMDEYIGLEPDANQRFSTFLIKSIFDDVKPQTVHLLMPEKDNPEMECDRYTRLLEEEEIDIVCLGIGENGHIAFNDPEVADFHDPKKVKVVKLDSVCRQQQVNDGCFERIDQVPTHAVTLTIPMLLSGRHLFTIVPGENKRWAAQRALSGTISEECPASILKTHEGCRFYGDVNSYPV